MIHNGVFCLAFDPDVKPQDEVAVVWNEQDEEYAILGRDCRMEEMLHEDGTWRKPTPAALAEAWATVKSMNRRVREGRNRREKG